jgi:hypothetical protein
MPDVESLSFTHIELLKLMIREAKIREGKWMLQVQFNIIGGNFGPDQGHVSPGAMIVVDQIGLARAKDGAPPSLVIDASDAYSDP